MASGAPVLSSAWVIKRDSLRGLQGFDGSKAFKRCEKDAVLRFGLAATFCGGSQKIWGNGRRAFESLL